MWASKSHEFHYSGASSLTPTRVLRKKRRIIIIIAIFPPSCMFAKWDGGGGGDALKMIFFKS